MKRTLIAFGAALVLGMPLVHAKPFKWSSAGEIATWDIHSQNNALQNGIHAAVYESLVYYNSKTFKVEPVLAESWREISPTQVRFSLRKGVKFHDGSPLTADDVVFSIQRAMAKTSNSPSTPKASTRWSKSMRTRWTSSSRAPTRCCSTSSPSCAS
jgi:peptide/nickel transport system substrate-binding protein